MKYQELNSHNSGTSLTTRKSMRDGQISTHVTQKCHLLFPHYHWYKWGEWLGCQIKFSFHFFNKHDLQVTWKWLSKILSLANGWVIPDGPTNFANKWVVMGKLQKMSLHSQNYICLYPFCRTSTAMNVLTSQEKTYFSPKFKGLCFYKTCEHRSRGSIVGTVSRLQDAQSCILIPFGEKLFSSAKCSDHLWGPPCLLFNVYCGSFPGVKWIGQKDDHMPPSNSKVKNKKSYISVPPLCLCGTDRIITFLSFYISTQNIIKTWSFVCD